MDDSSTNPYIPKESDAIRQKVYERQSPLGRVVKWALIITAVVAVLVGGGLFFVLPQTTAVDQEARQKLADILQPPDQTLKRVNVTSMLGFTLNYDNHIYDSYAEVGDGTAGTDNSEAKAKGQTYENNDLRVQRAYNYVRIRPIESVSSVRTLKPIPPQLELFATVTANDLAREAAVPENKNLSQLSLFVKIDEDKRQAQKVLDDNTVVTVNASKPIATTIGDVDYQMVRYTTTNENHRISDIQYDDCYYTIQFSQPYSICITGVRPTSVSAASLVEQVFNSIVFEQPQTTLGGSASTTTTPAADTSKGKSKKVSYVYPLARLAQAALDTGTDVVDSNGGNNSESSLLTITPAYYNNAGGLKSIAKAQPSVVRIGTLYCANVSLKYQSGDTAATLTDACTGGVSSGAFISKDGYIATTGHAIRSQKKALIDGYINFAPDQSTMLDRLQRMLDYLVKAQIILQSDADYLQTGASIGDQEALAKIENIASVIPEDFIVPIDEEYTYAVQPADQPIVINRSDTNKPSFAYSDAVLEAKYITSEYDASKSIQEVFGSATPSVDVGLLKVSGSFPDVPVVSAQTVKTNSVLSTIGYPAYTDSSLAIDKIRNIPVVTSSKVEQVYQQDKGGRSLIQTDTPVLPGNDGAPVFDTNGQLIGFSVYGLSYCPDGSCFANGTVRTAEELLKLLDDNNISLQTESPISQGWFGAVDQYFKANYAASSSSFQVAGSMYSFNRWASPLQKQAAAGEGTKYDTSFMNQLATIMIWALGTAVVSTILLAVALFVHKRRIGSLQVGHYGAMDNNPVTSSGVVSGQTAPSMPLPPVQPAQPFNTAPSQASPQPQMPVQQVSPSQSSSPELQIRGDSNGTFSNTQHQTPELGDLSVPVAPQPPEMPNGDSPDSFYK